MNKLEETIGFLEMLKGLNKTVVEIDLIMPMLAEMQEEAINYTRCCETLSDKPSFMEFERTLKKDIFDDGKYGWLYNGSWLAKSRLKEIWLEKYYL